MNTRMHHNPTRPQFVIYAAIFLVGLMAGTVVTVWADNSTPRTLPSLAPKLSEPAPETLPLAGTFAPVVQDVTPAVASITASRVVRIPQQLPFPFFGPGFPNPFGEPDQDGSGGNDDRPSRRQQGLGSGVIVTSDGYLLTNHHVIDGASKIKVQLADDREFDAEIVGSDAGTDIAVLKIDAEDLPVAHFGNSANVRVGDLVFAVGNPFGVGQTVTMGIVGATGRGGLNIEDYEDFIQTDAAINPGNSGGALIDISGKLIGINTAIVAGAGRGNQGVGFAVPVNMAHSVMNQLIKTGKVTRGYLGVVIQNIDSSIAESFNAPDANGALVSRVEDGTPAAKAGLKRGDIIRELNGEAVHDVRNLRLAVASTQPGTTVQLAVWREGSEETISVTLEELPGRPQTAESRPSSGGAIQGVTVSELSPAVARRLGVDPQTQGVVVTDVSPGSAAFEAGLRRGDVIEEVDRKTVRNTAEFRDAVAGADDDTVLLLVNRGGDSLFLAVEQRED